MPVMDGYTAAALIRSLELGAKPTHRVSVIAITGFGPADDRAKCVEAAGMDDFITKPVSAEDVRNIVHRCPYRSPGGSRPGVFDRVKLSQVTAAGGADAPGGAAVVFSVHQENKQKELEQEYWARLRTSSASVVAAVRNRHAKTAAAEAELLAKRCALPVLEQVRMNVRAIGVTAKAICALAERRGQKGDLAAAGGDGSGEAALWQPMDEMAASLIKQLAYAGSGGTGRDASAAGRLIGADSAEEVESVTRSGASSKEGTTLEPRPPSCGSDAPAAARKKRGVSFDRGVVLQNVDGMHAVMHKLLGRFSSHTKTTISQLRAAVEKVAGATEVDEKSVMSMKRIAHSLKGSASYVAADRLKDASITLMDAAAALLDGQSKPGPWLIDIVDGLSAEMQNVLEDIAAEIGTESPSAPPSVSSARSASAASASAAAAAAASASSASSEVPSATSPTTPPRAASSSLASASAPSRARAAEAEPLVYLAQATDEALTTSESSGVDAWSARAGHASSRDSWTGADSPDVDASAFDPPVDKSSQAWGVELAQKVQDLAVEHE